MRSSIREESYYRLLPVAQAAWNAALLPDPDRKEVIDEAVSRAAFSPKEARRIINDLIVDKGKPFFRRQEANSHLSAHNGRRQRCASPGSIRLWKSDITDREAPGGSGA